MDATRFRILETGDEEALKAFLVKRLDSSLFLYGNLLAAGLEDTGQRHAGTYAAATKGQQIVAVVGLFWNQTIVLQAASHLPELMPLAQQACGRPIRRIVGPNEQVFEAIGALGLAEEDLQMDEAEGLYSLALAELIVPELLTSGQAIGRRIRESDLDFMSRWRLGYIMEMHLEEDTPELREVIRRNVSDEITSGRTWILEVGGEPVSSTTFNAVVQDEGVASIVQVGGVYTPPKLRSRGYARAAVAASLLDARSQGYQKGVLFTGVSNIAAQKAYIALGFQLIGSYRITVLREGIQ